MTNILALLCMAGKFLMFEINDFTLQICQLLVVFQAYLLIYLRSLDPMIPSITEKNRYKNKIGLSFFL